MARLGRAQAFAPFQFGAIAAGVDVTVALTGQAITGALGSLIPVANKALSGAAVTASAGTLTPALAKALSGGSVAMSQGSVSVPGASTPSETGVISIIVRRRRLLQ